MPGGFKKAWLALGLAIAFMVAAGYFDKNQEKPDFRRPPAHIEEAPPPKEPEGPRLPGPSTFDPTFTIETGDKANSTGTAFAIRDDGVWMTARHVIDGCDKIGIIVAPRKAYRVSSVQVHPRADMAVLRTGTQAPALAISAETLHEHQPGFHFGFPQAEPGEVASLLLGRLNMRTVGRYRHTEPVVAWAERSRYPETDTLGGISGGPALNAKGEIVGVTVASSKRRGRIMTTAPVSMESMLSLAGVRAAGTPSAGLNTGPSDGNFVDYGNALRRQLTVAQVICRVGDSSRRPRAQPHN